MHRRDIEILSADGIPLPFDYAEAADGGRQASSYWVRIRDSSQALISGFAVRTSISRALPGTLTGRVERVGRLLHTPVIHDIGHLLMKSALALPRLQRLDVRIVDENPVRRRAFADSILSAGGTPSTHRALYTRTLITHLDRAADGSWPTLSKAARYRLRKFARLERATVLPITDTRYARRMLDLYTSTFDRTGGRAPEVDWERLIRSANRGSNSRLVGVFFRDRHAPDDLVAFMRAVFHGDHGSYEQGASERSREVGSLPVGYPLMDDLLEWTRTNGGTWFDFGGIPTDGSPAAEPLAGIVGFKRQFSRNETEIAQELVLVARPKLALIANLVRTATRIASR